MDNAKKPITERINITVVICVTAIIAALALAVLTVTQKATNNNTISELQTTATNSCVVSNENRAATNASNYITYKGLQQSVKYTESQQASQRALLVHLGLSEKVIDEAVTESNNQLQNQKARLRVSFWTQLADCAHPNKGASKPQVFSFQKKTPDISQLSINNATHITPNGSNPEP